MRSVVAFLLWLFSVAAAADEGPLSLRMETNALEVVQGESFQLDVVLTVRSNDTVEDMSLPNLAEFTVVREQRGSSTAVTTRNGRRQVTVEQRFSFILRSDQAGPRTIGEARVRLGKAVARAAPLTIQVKPGKPGSAPTAPDEDPLAVGDAGDTPGARFGAAPPSIFLEVRVDKKTVSVGEQVTATTELYSQSPLDSWPKLPGSKPKGFLCITLDDSARTQATQRTIAGRAYSVYKLSREALFPLETGDQTIPGQSLQVSQGGSLFRRGRDSTITAPPVVVRVDALPGEGRPHAFDEGAVGSFTMSTSIAPASVALDQTATLRTVITGSGALERVRPPVLEAAKDLRVFPSSTRVERQDSGETVGGRIIVETLLQPTRSGRIELPALRLQFFDPKTKRYEEARSTPLVLLVGGSDARDQIVRAAAGAHAIARAPKPALRRVELASNPGYVEVAAGSGVLFTGGGVFAWGTLRRRRRGTHAVLVEERHARRRRTLQDAKTRGDLALASSTLTDVLVERAGEQVRAAALADLPAILGEAGLSPALIDRSIAFLRAVEAARYAPAASVDRQKLVTEAAALVDEIARTEAAA